MAHLHKVYDSDTHFKIDATSRIVINESDIKKIMLIQNDHNSERFTFELPRYIEEHDMTLCDVVEIHYINTDSKTKESMKDVYIVDDLQVYPDDENVVVLSWLLSRNATKYVGNLSFLICFKCLDGTEIEYMWSTAIYSKITVGTSIYNSEQVVEIYSDVLEAWKNDILNVAGDAEALVGQSVSNYMVENPVVVDIQATDEMIQYSMGDDNWKDIIPIADLKGEKGEKGDQGEKGETGDPGVYIVNMEQTTKSEEDDGENIVTMTLSDGNVYTFTVQNGSRGTDGVVGKSAYEAAKEAGYTGTEEQFAYGMAAMDNLPSAGVKISGILPAGETEITLTSDEIKEDSRLDAVYTSIFGVPVQSAEFEAGGITLIFPAQEEDMTVAALFDATVANGEDGEDGAPGADGKDGQDGAPGKSAYAYAQDGGYTGTEEEFAELLANGGSGDYLAIENPTGTGSFSMNREEGSTVGIYSSVFGRYSIASGDYSHAEGYASKATDFSAHAEGGGTTASGSGSHAEGGSTTASGAYSHAEGNYTVADGNYSHAEGYYTIAKQNIQHVQGKNNIEDTENKYAHIVGNGKDQHNRSNAHTLDWDGNAWFAGDVKATDAEGNEVSLVDLAANAGSGDEYLTKVNPTGTGSFSMNRKANSTVGDYSTTLGSNNTASGNCSTAEGLYTTASGDKSHAEGYQTTASGHYGSHAEGYYTTASSLASHAEGWYTTASGQFSHAEGNKTTAASKSQHVQGQYNIPDTENKYLHIVGNGDPDYYIQSNAHTLDWDGNAWFAGDVTATDSSGNSVSLLSLANGGSGGDYLPLTNPSGTGSFSMNRKAETEIGANSTALGFDCTASGEGSYAEGNSTTASGIADHAEGFETIASGSYSHAEGYGSNASGQCAHAENYWTVASGEYSHAEGSNTIASGMIQHVQGKFNVADTENTYAHIVGNGESDATRSNAHTLDWNGNAWFAGDVTATGANGKSVNLLSALTSGDVVNNLTSTATNVPLSANQGRLLKEQIANAGGSKWTLVLNNDTSSKVDLTNYSEIRVYVYGKAENSVCRYSMSHDFLIDELLSQDSYFATIPGNIGYGDDFDNAFIDFYPTTSKRSFGVGYVDARFGGEYCSDATFKIYAR